MDYHYVREMVLSKFLHVSYLSTTQQPADIFTKSLSKDRFHFLRGKLPVRATPFSLRGDIDHKLHSQQITPHEGKENVIHSFSHSVIAPSRKP
ncbi:hypothetical protein RchiOBHm_Chr2g0129171 [Rosa chinensis]|uniref:RNA-directed DNA polymerase n=1 Tax=Rosa chinensis TaxID=74649 RepID=A0A2P6RUI3_ROSCH|nr:hypothetical protein RchiOBHm_Chr2g0129171 [Rosa chinensis]